VGEVLLSPAKRWDSGWFIVIARDGYDAPDPDRAAFFPLYPLLIRIVGEPIGSLEVAGVAVSLVAFIVGLYLLHRLTELEVGRPAADRTVLLLALFPMAFYFSAIYSESLFLALTVGSLYAARRGRWMGAAILGALAAATRSSGVMLVIPLLIMLLYGPAENRDARPRARDLAAVLAVPLGLLAYMAGVRLTTRFGFLAPFKAQGDWMRELKGPIVGLWGGVKNGVWGAREAIWGASLTEPVSAVRSGLLNFAALVFASIGVVGAFRRLPAAYGAYALAGLLFAISFPANDLMLKSLPRLVVVLFPIFMWLGIVTERRSFHTVALVASAVGLAWFSAMFASWYWIA
jgi:hypothetical protein